MMTAQQTAGTAAHSGQYKIRVPLKTLLDANQVQTLVASLQRSYDDGTAGQFEVSSTGHVSMVTFYREMSDDVEVIQDNMARMMIAATEPTAAAVEQLAAELSEHQDESLYVQEIVATMREQGGELMDVGDHAMVRQAMTEEQAWA